MDNKPTDKCPLCGQDNRCAIAAGKPPDTCWCMQTRVPDTLLASLPASEQGRRCICEQCIKKGGKVH